MRPKRIAICATKVPFARGGAEILVESLQRELIQRGFETDLISLPFKWHPHSEIIKGALAWRLLDLTESNGQKIDMVIATKFPSYTVKHPNKVVWLIHQFRQAYELYGTPYSDLTNTPEDRRIRDMIHSADARTLGEARRIFTIAQNTTNRLARYNHLHGEPLYHPPKLDGLYHNEQYGDYVFSIGRLNKMKRVALLIEAMRHTRTGVRCLIAGSGREREPLQKMIEKMGLGHRVTLLGYVDDKHQVELYANCMAVFYAPYDEDYGYVTLEAFKSRKPVITASDSGGVLEFVEHERTGYVCASDAPRQIAARIDHLYAHRELCKSMGEAGCEKVKGITWDVVISKLTEGLR